MKFIFTADIHLKLWNDKEYTETGIPKKLIEILATVEQMCTYAHENKIDAIVVGGDINDTKENASVSAFVLFKQIINKYNDIKFHFLHGNHDAVSTVEGRESAIQILDGPENVTTYLEPKVVELCNRNILFLPHSHGMIDNLKKYINSKDIDIMVSHFGLSDAFLSSGISIRTGIKSSDFRKFKLTLLGHYHKPQEIINDNHSVYYAGSPIAIRRDEAGEDKRFLVIDTDTFEVESVNTEGYRRFFEIVIDENSNIEELKEQIEKIKNSGDYLVLKKTIANIPKGLEDVITENTVIDLYQRDITLRGITASMSDVEQMKKYLEIKEIPEEDHDDYISVGIEIINYDLEEN